MTETSRQTPTHHSVALHPDKLKNLLQQNNVELTTRQELQQIERDTLYYQNGLPADVIAHRLEVMFGPDIDTTSVQYQRQCIEFSAQRNARDLKRQETQPIRYKRN